MQSDSADELFLIKGGRVKLEKVFEDGSELTLDIRKAGDFVGENSFSEEAEYPVSAVCMEDTLTCGFNKKQFEQLILDNPNIGLQVIKNLSDRVTRLTSQVGSLAVTNIEERLYRLRFLLTQGKLHGMIVIESQLAGCSIPHLNQLQHILRHQFSHLLAGLPGLFQLN